MSTKTRIEWTHIPGYIGSTWNPWYGCSKVSPGCDHCYAEAWAKRTGHAFDMTRASHSTFYAPRKWKEPHAIFTCSLSDFFHKEADEWRKETWNIIKSTPHHLYLILTKRIGRAVWWAEQHGWPDHVWIGTSVESGKYLSRLDVLARVPAQVRFVSVEPILGPLWVQDGVKPDDYDDDLVVNPKYTEWERRCERRAKTIAFNRLIHWVIVGGESGPKYRPAKVDWITSIVDACWANEVPVFVKQDSGLYPGRQGRIPDTYWIHEFPLQ